MSGRSMRSVAIGARAIILRKNAATESVGRSEDGGHRRYGSGERSGGAGEGWEEWSGER